MVTISRKATHDPKYMARVVLVEHPSAQCSIKISVSNVWKSFKEILKTLLSEYLSKKNVLFKLKQIEITNFVMN